MPTGMRMNKADKRPHQDLPDPLYQRRRCDTRVAPWPELPVLNHNGTSETCSTPRSMPNCRASPQQMHPNFINPGRLSPLHGGKTTASCPEPVVRWQMILW